MYHKRTAWSPIFSFDDSVYAVVRFHLLSEDRDI